MDEPDSVFPDFDAAWRNQRGEVRPIGYELRTSLPETWVRFHSLPESKRIAENDAEYEELLARHLTILTELGPNAGALRVVTASWSESPDPVPREPDVTSAFPSASYWRSVQPNQPDDLWTHLYVGTATLDSKELRQLLLLVADDRAADVILSPPTAEWLYHPYDGGGDVIAPDVATRDLLRSRHREWLSTHPAGL